MVRFFPVNYGESTPLVGIPYGDGYILIGSNFGQAHHPAWASNLRAHPNASLTRSGLTRAYLAREVRGGERETCWQKTVSHYAGYAACQARAGREIAVFVLEPQE
ncbi:MAG: nitroreductase family deazaflavin-dependent oxidoreductase [Chloroflexi bacterium]|nr:nitroreductase family deazaflavin-dependent oxidoreductase [Chloroflexota bacterium]